MIAQPATTATHAAASAARENRRQGPTAPRYAAAARTRDVHLSATWEPDGAGTVGALMRTVRQAHPRSGGAGIPVAGGFEARVFRGVGVPFEAIAVPVVDLAPGEALVAVELATICGCDVRVVQGSDAAPVPLVLGHEVVGHVAALGPGRAPRDLDGRHLVPGQRIVWGVGGCGRCRRCSAGMPQTCGSRRRYGRSRLERGWELSGGFATHVHLRARTPVVVVPEALPAELVAPASCATASAMAALGVAREVRPIAGAVVVVVGCGMRGLTAVVAAVAEGATVLALDGDRERRAAAEELGAAAAGEATADGLAVALQRVRLPRRPPIVLDFVGVPDVAWALGGVTIRGGRDVAPEHLREAVAFLARPDAAALAALVGDIHPLGEIESAMLHARAHASVRVGLRPDAKPARAIGSELSARPVLGHHPSTNPPQAES